MSKKNSFKQRLQYLIDDKKISQIDVSIALGVNESRVSEWLKGAVKTPRRTTLQKISDVFECDIDWLADGTGEPFPTAKETTAGNQPTTLSHQDESPSNKELVTMTAEILESDTEFKPALVANIRSYHSAMTMENDMKKVEEEMGDMKKRLERIETLLLSITKTLPEKRDKAANS